MKKRMIFKVDKTVKHFLLGNFKLLQLRPDRKTNDDSNFTQKIPHQENYCCIN